MSTDDPGRGDAGPEVTVSREELRVRTEWIATGRCRLRRLIVTETRTVEVTVQREVLVVDGVDLGGQGERLFGIAADGPITAPPRPVEPLVIVLHEQVPEVVLHNRAYEQITARVVQVANDHTVGARLSHEKVDLTVLDAARPTDGRSPHV